jgi:hypothetical protein
LLGLLVVDLFLAFQGSEMQETLFVDGLDEVPKSVSLIRGVPGERFWSGTDRVPMEKWQAPTPSDLSPGVYRARATSIMLNLMASCAPAQYGTSGLTGAWGALMPLYRHPRPIYDPRTPLEVQFRWLELLNVRYFLLLRPRSDPHLRLLTKDPLYIYEDPAVFPRPFWVPRARSVSGEDAIALVSSPDFDPRQEVAMEEESEPTSSRSDPTAAGGGPVAGRIVEYRPEHVRLEVTAPAAGILVLMDSVYPGWRATVDGQPEEIRPANWTGRGIRVEAGTHQVRMDFMPASVRVGLFFSLAALAAVAGSAAASRRRSA